MSNFLINQKIKKIKDFDSFDYLINWDGVHTLHPTSTKVNVQLDFKVENKRKIKKSKKIKGFDSFDYLITRESIREADSKGG